MPRVIPQTQTGNGAARAPARVQARPTQTSQPTGGVLSRIGPVKQSNLGRLKVAAYGRPKTGKTRLACTFPKPLLLIGAEDGTASVVGVDGVDFVQLANSSEFGELVGGPVADGKYATVVLDTATKLKDMRVAELWASKGGVIPQKKPFMYANEEWKQVWVQTSNDMKDMLRPLYDLWRQINLNIVIIAQEQNFQEEGSSSELIMPTIGCAVGKSVCDFICAESDYICQTFLRPQVRQVERTVGQGKAQKKMMTEVPTGKTEYCLGIAAHPVYMRGFRVSHDLELPDEIVNPTYSEIAALITGDQPQ